MKRVYDNGRFIGFRKTGFLIECHGAFFKSQIRVPYTLVSFQGSLRQEPFIWGQIAPGVPTTRTRLLGAFTGMWKGIFFFLGGGRACFPGFRGLRV